MSKGMIEIDDKLYAYMLSVTLRESALLHRLRDETNANVPMPGMQISPDQGQFMALIAELIGAKRYLEVGTYTGYSALAVVQAMGKGGHAICCDVSEEFTNVAKRYWEEAGVEDQIDLKLAPAADTLQAMVDDGHGGSIDLMFIDADKVNYATYYELGLELVRKGGLIMIDNVLWSGAVIDESKQDEDTKAIRALNQDLLEDERVSLSLIPIGDGLTFALKR